MKLGVIIAIKPEGHVLKQYLKKTTHYQGAFPVISGALGENEIVLCTSGPGKVNAAAACQYLISRFNPDSIVNLGICGGLKREQKIGDVILSNRFIQYDYQMKVPGKHEAWHPTYRSHEVLTLMPEFLPTEKTEIIVTGDRFICDESEKRELRENYKGAGCDMESAALAQIACLNQKSFASVRGISDLAQGLPEDFHENMKEAVDSASLFLINSLLK